MLKKSAFASFLMVCYFILSPCSFAQTDQSHDEFSDLLRSEDKELTRQEVDEIIAIRNRLGGGTGLELDRLFVESDTEKSQANDQRKPIPGLPAQTVAAKSLPPSTLVNKFEFRTTQTKPEITPKLSSYRKIARKMDELAADLEDLDLFVDADLLRAGANRLRLKVRTEIQKAN